MLKLIYQSVVMSLLLVALLCGAYPLAVTAIGQMFFPKQANGSIVVDRSGAPVGSTLIAQSFTRPEYFHPRPSSAGDKGYDASNSSGSNLGPTSQKFYDAVKSNVDGYLKENPQVKPGQVPVDAATASGSGLDPHISPENAFAQAARVAEARRVSPEFVQDLVRTHIEGPFLGIFGEPVVNVLMLNLALEEQFKK